MFIKRMLFLVFSFFITSCTIDVTEELTSSSAKSKSITVNLEFPEGCYAYTTVRTNLSSSLYVIIEPGETIYSRDNGVVVKAIGSHGYLFREWVGEDIADPQSNSTSVLLNTNKTITGVFVEDPNPTRVTVRCKTPVGGIIDFGIFMSAHYYNGDVYYSGVSINQEVIIEAIAEEGYKFSHWIGDNIRDKNSSYTFFKTPNYNTTIEAVFTKIDTTESK